MAAEGNSQTPKEEPKLSLAWHMRFSISLFAALNDVACRSDGTINRRLLKFLDHLTKPSPTPTNGVTSKDVTVDAAKDVWFRLYTPSAPAIGATTLPVFIFFHGGGFAFLSAASFGYDAVCRRFCRKLNAVVVSVNYRLTPEHRHPCQYDDGFAAVKFLEENPSVLPENADLAKCFLAGDSAGANLAHHVAIRVAQSEPQKVRIIGLVSIQPFFGGEERTEAENRLGNNAPLVSLARTDWLWKAFLPNGSDRNHGSVNVSGPNALDISGLNYPNTLVFLSGYDPLKDWQRRYYEWLRKSGQLAGLVWHDQGPSGTYLK
ncbi:hypothetical protein PIB30_002541 [Stylosanthes scabra]|uniref:Alpha/beta hydrolase fold-3 domain-containing protein n=1 Tax=Stylosanthes scabra TaxID=79078 RepID=A0ABU6XZU7_9FABA|nr:hypothetical protein [Stylosanthes scabra]